MKPQDFPKDLKAMSLTQLSGLADDLRQTMVATCLKNGGHLGPSLGAVELAISLHYVFDSPREPLVWDVGHQAYAHKLLTGRWARFNTLRKSGGLSGFLSRDENEHDVFGAGHSSTALSAALAMAYSRAGTNDWSVAIVGDGSLSAGLAFEALNQCSSVKSGPLLLVLNDNQLSISKNVGALAKVFADGRAGAFFELLGFDYVGPVDGHDLAGLIGSLQGIRSSSSGRPVVLHALTQKGKGYAPAEESPVAYHGISEPVLHQKTYSEAFGEALCALAEKDPKIVAITAAMPEGTGLSEFARRFPNRFFDVGIAEPHAVTFAAGLATQGFKPVVAIYSTFLQRSLDGIIHDVALQRLGVTFAIDRAGLVGADGPTHHGAFDLVFLGMIPEMTVSAPACLADLESELALAIHSGRPWAIRYPRGPGPFELGFEKVGTLGEIYWHQRTHKPKVIAVGVGPVAGRLAAAARSVDPGSVEITALSMIRTKPLSGELLDFLRGNPEAKLLIVEEGVVRGGVGQAISAELGARSGEVKLLGFPDAFVAHGATESLEDELGLSALALVERLRALLQ
ncbi:1-deoxy-D-xylulose-5-phosphate synthase [Bdellovibrionota bacterium FG-1]